MTRLGLNSVLYKCVEKSHMSCFCNIHLRETYTIAIRFKDRFSVELGRGWHTEEYEGINK